MKRKRTFHSAAVIMATFMLHVSCVQRDAEMGLRNNPCDPGGNSWTINAPPEIAVQVDSVWADADHENGTGTLLFTIAVTDPNFPYDTLSGQIEINDAYDALLFHEGRTDCVIERAALKPDTTYRCIVRLTDRMPEEFTRDTFFVTPGVLPLQAPVAYIVSGENAVLIRWNRIPDVTEYIIYYADDPSGPYDNRIVVEQTSEEIVSVVDTLDDNGPRYYIIASSDSSGSSFSHDTLIGTVYSTSVPSPGISVSKGTYAAHIKLSISVVNASQIHYVTIFRSESSGGTFFPLDTLHVPGTNYYSYSMNYNDSVTTADTFYYYATSVDRYGGSSRPGSTGSGFLRAISAPASTSISSADDHILLTWSRVDGASYYRIYRSSVSCSEGFTFLDSVVTENLYTDTPPTSDTYYYKISAVDAKGTESAKGNCREGKITVLPAPEGLTATDTTYGRHVRLSWNQVPGATGYIIYRKNGPAATGTFSAVDTTDTVSSNDSLPGPGSYMYRVAAYNDRGIGASSATAEGCAVSPASLIAESIPEQIVLEWPGDFSVRLYYIYRSSDGSSFTMLDSAESSPYYDNSFDDYGTYYYRMTFVTSEGESFPGATVSGQPTMHMPSKVDVTTGSNSVTIRWNRILGAETYLIYRSETPSDTVYYTAVTDTFFTDTLLSNETYYYRIQAKNSQVTGRVTRAYYGGSESLPLPPTFTYLSSSPTVITIKWKLREESAPADGYYIYRSTTESGGYELIDSTPSYVTTYSDTVPDTVRYYYRLSTYNSAGESTLNEPWDGKRLTAGGSPPSPPGSIGATKGTRDYIVINWSASAGADGYRVYRSLVVAFDRDIILLADNSVYNTSDIVDSDSVYFYKVSAYNSYGESDLSSSFAAGYRSPSRKAYTPENPRITVNGDSIIFYWDPPSTAVGFDHYYVHRAPDEDGPYALVDSVNTECIYTEMPPERYPTVYWYMVSAVNQMGASAPTSPVSGSVR